MSAPYPGVFDSTPLRPLLQAVKLDQHTPRHNRPPEIPASDAPMARPRSAYFLGSRFCSSSSGLTLHSTPSVGTSSFAVHKRALSTSLRKFGSPQFLCV